MAHILTPNILVALAALLLGACAQAPYVPEPAEPATIPGLPVGEYQAAARAGDLIYRIDRSESRIFLRIGRDGPMKELGHDHVIASEHVDGLVLLTKDPNRSRANLRIPLQQLVVDDPDYRSRFELEPDVSADAISGTTRNMQEKVLESGAFPWAEVAARFASANDDPPTLAVSITLHGTSAEYVVPVSINAGEDGLSVRGEMTLGHADFALEPFSAAGGLLRVAGDVGVVFELAGQPVSPAELAASR